MQSFFRPAVNHLYLYEIGPWFNPNDLGTISGLCSTPQQKRMVGYVNTPGDGGGLTKYGIASTDHPTVDIAHLNLAQATDIYLNEYWLAIHLDEILSGVSIFLLDMAVNNGNGRAAKILQQACGATIDGNIGPATIEAANKMNPEDLLNKLYSLRIARYNSIAANNPDDQKFLAGWLTRALEVMKFTRSNLS